MDNPYALNGTRMKKLLLCFFLVCNVSILTEGVHYSLGNGSFEMEIPKGYLPLYVSSGTDNDECWEFLYPDGSFIYVSNGWSPNVKEIISKYHFFEMAIPITNNGMVRYGSTSIVLAEADEDVVFLVPDSLALMGYSLFERNWAEKEYRNYCVGYRKVPFSRLKSFKKAIDSFRIVP